MPDALNIKIDLTSVVNEFKELTNNIDTFRANVIRAVTLALYRQWAEEAKKSLKSTRANYINGLQISDVVMGSASITLVGTINNMVESGTTSFDMKVGFSKSRGIKQGKNGWYLTIPFRHANPNAIGESEIFASKLPPEIYEAVSKAKVINDRQTLTNAKLPSQFANPVSRMAISDIATRKTFDEYVHKTAIYAGLVKNTPSYGKTKQSTFTTFRRVSAMSNKTSWIHKGIMAYNLAEKAVANADVDTVVNNAIDKFISEI